MKIEDIGRIKESLFSCEDVIASYLFGSHASEKHGPRSDVDIAVLFDATVKRKDYGFNKLNIITDLIELLSLNTVDVVILNSAPPLLSHEVIKKGRLLFSKDDKKLYEYTVRATTRYLDTIYLRRVQDRILHEKIRRGDFGYFRGSHKYSIEKIRKGSPDTPADR
jgi:predicted nucleotidyltransferase